MRSIRLDNETEKLVRRAAQLEGVSVSEFMRRAAAERTERTLSARAVDRLADVVGSVHGDGRRARRAGAGFTDALRDRRRHRR